MHKNVGIISNKLLALAYDVRRRVVASASQSLLKEVDALVAAASLVTTCRRCYCTSTNFWRRTSCTYVLRTHLYNNTVVAASKSAFT